MLEQAKYTDRVITIEEGSREFALLKRDAQGNIINNVLSKLTRDSDNPDLVIDQEDLLEHCLRENPDIMGIGEMRSAEAYTVAEAAAYRYCYLYDNACFKCYRYLQAFDGIVLQEVSYGV